MGELEEIKRARAEEGVALKDEIAALKVRFFARLVAHRRLISRHLNPSVSLLDAPLPGTCLARLDGPPPPHIQAPQPPSSTCFQAQQERAEKELQAALRAAAEEAARYREREAAAAAAARAEAAEAAARAAEAGASPAAAGPGHAAPTGAAPTAAAAPAAAAAPVAAALGATGWGLDATALREVVAAVVTAMHGDGDGGGGRRGAGTPGGAGRGRQVGFDDGGRGAGPRPGAPPFASTFDPTATDSSGGADSDAGPPASAPAVRDVLAKFFDIYEHDQQALKEKIRALAGSGTTTAAARAGLAAAARPA